MLARHPHPTLPGVSVPGGSQACLSETLGRHTGDICQMEETGAQKFTFISKSGSGLGGGEVGPVFICRGSGLIFTLSTSLEGKGPLRCAARNPRSGLAYILITFSYYQLWIPLLHRPPHCAKVPQDPGGPSDHPHCPPPHGAPEA